MWSPQRFPYNCRTMHHLGSTRSRSQREYLLHTPDAFVRTPLPGLTGGTAIVHVAPEMGAAFAMSTLELEPGGRLTGVSAQRFLYVLEGHITVHDLKAGTAHEVNSGGFAYLPEAHPHHVSAPRTSRVLAVEKPFEHAQDVSAQSNSQPLFGHEDEVASSALNGDPDLQVRALLPSTNAFDFAVNTMTYAPGASLSQVEVHYMEHGLLMLEGGGIYRFGDDWHPVQAGDAVWMAPFCPQWFAAVGKQPAKYIIYKNFNRHVLA